MALLRGLADAADAVRRRFGTAMRGLSQAGHRAGRYARRHLRLIRHRSANGEAGMIRLLDVHAASCAGDALVAIGLAGTIFFSVPVGEARSRVALYLLITMAPFALLAPLAGPLLDRFRHGRRYALATTMLGRGFLAWVISDNLDTLALYPAAFGILVLSRTYGVARSAAVPRLLPPTLGLVEAGARTSLYGTIAGALAAPLGVALFQVGPQWTLRLSTVVFAIGMVIALRLPPRADSDPPETAPRLFSLPNRHTVAVLTGRLVTVTLTASAALRAGYGFLLLFVAFRVREGDFATVRPTVALAVIAAAFGAGSLIATVLCARLTIHRPLLLQGGALLAVTAATIVAAWWYGIVTVAVACGVLALASGVCKFAVDAVIQERIDERVRASAFAHSETLLILAWVAGGGVGLIPFAGQLGLAILVSGLTLAVVRVAKGLLGITDQRLRGVVDDQPADTGDAANRETEPLSPQRESGSS